jgi:tRNA pseudouridine38-40 synthase
MRWAAAELRSAINANLPPEIWVAEARRARPDFHPRYHATARSYEYRLGTTRDAASPFFRRWCWNASTDPPNRELLVEAAARILGNRSFRAFAKAGQPRRGDRCRVTAARWTGWEGPGLRFLVTADRFLHHMVRYLVGTMVDVARGRRPLTDLEELLDGPEGPLVTSPPAPPEGLFLSGVEYPAERIGAHPDRDPRGGRDEHESARTPTVETDA